MWSRGVQSDLDVACGIGIEGVVGDGEVTQAVDQEAGDASQAAEEGGDGVAAGLSGGFQQVAFFHQLHDGVGDLQQAVVGLHDAVVVAVGVFQIVAAVFLCVEALVFNLPSGASSIGGDSDNVVGGDGEVGDPGEGSGSAAECFVAHDHVEGMIAAFGVGVDDTIDPSVYLAAAVGQVDDARVGGGQVEQLLNVGPHRREESLS